MNLAAWLSFVRRRSGAIALLALAAVAVPAVASAQFAPRGASAPVLGERYHVEIGGAFWNPQPFGVISSDELSIIGSDVDLVGDLGYKKTRFREFRFVLRPGTRHRIRAQYTPIEYTAQSTLTRDITFSGRTFNVALPIESNFSWKVWRFGYEYDFIYQPRGFVGVMVEGKWTDAKADVTSAVASGAASAQALLPAIGLVARAYPLPDLAINLEVSGMKIPQLQQKYEGSWVDWDLSGTVNVTNNFGVQVGWRRTTTFVVVEGYTGDLKFQGMYFGFATRF